MANSDFGLKDYHEANIVNYMRFSRAQRALSIRTIQAGFRDIQNSRLKNETTLTVDEVEDVLGELWEAVKEEIDTELSHQSHTYVLLLRQLFLQAEHWHLKMQADISELENKELLDKIKNFENEQFNSSKKKNEYVAPRLEPVNDTGGTALLRNQIDRLSAENEHLKEKLQYLEQKLVEMSNQKSNSKSNDSASASSKQHGDINELEKQISNLRTEMSKTKDNSNEKALESEMISAKHRYLEVLEQLKMAEKELEKKFNQTNAYKNMKQMLEKKNDQIKELRKRLDRYEPDA